MFVYFILTKILVMVGTNSAGVIGTRISARVRGQVSRCVNIWSDALRTHYADELPIHLVAEHNGSAEVVGLFLAEGGAGQLEVCCVGSQLDHSPRSRKNIHA